MSNKTEEFVPSTANIASVPIFDRSPFVFSDAGDIAGDKNYKTQVSSKIWSKIVGRSRVDNETLDEQSFDASDVVREGFLFKRGSWMQGWKKRYFILRRDLNKLFFYKNNGKNLTGYGSVALTGADVVDKPEMVGTEPFTLAIVCDEGGGETRSLVLRAADSGEFQLWRSELAKACIRVPRMQSKHWWDRVVGVTVPAAPTPSDILDEVARASPTPYISFHPVSQELIANSVDLSSDEEDEDDDDEDDDIMALREDMVNMMKNEKKKPKKKNKGDPLSRGTFAERPVARAAANRMRMTDGLVDSKFRSGNEIIGFQLATKLQHICYLQDQICIVLLGGLFKLIETKKDTLRYECEWVEITRTEHAYIDQREKNKSRSTTAPEITEQFNVLLSANDLDVDAFQFEKQVKTKGYSHIMFLTCRMRESILDTVPLARVVVQSERLLSHCSKKAVLDNQYSHDMLK